MKNYKEIAKTNRFIANVAEIREIGVKCDVDAGISLDMYVAKHGINRAECNDEYQEFRQCMKEVSYDLRKIITALNA